MNDKYETEILTIKKWINVIIIDWTRNRCLIMFCQLEILKNALGFLVFVDVLKCLERLLT